MWMPLACRNGMAPSIHFTHVSEEEKGSPFANDERVHPLDASGAPRVHHSPR